MLVQGHTASCEQELRTESWLPGSAPAITAVHWEQVHMPLAASHVPEPAPGWTPRAWGHLHPLPQP